MQPGIQKTWSPQWNTTPLRGGGTTASRVPQKVAVTRGGLNLSSIGNFFANAGNYLRDVATDVLSGDGTLPPPAITTILPSVVIFSI